MSRIFENSLLIRLGASMATITLLGVLTMLASTIIEEMTQGEAAAINQAGSLRMQSYRIATTLVYNHSLESEEYWNLTTQMVSEFEERLSNPRLTGVIPHSEDHALRIAYKRIEDQWQKKIRPVLLVYVNLIAPKSGYFPTVPASDRTLWDSTRKNIRSRYLSIVDHFVEDINHLVMELEEDAEAKLRWLRLIQITSMFIIIAIVFRALYVVQTVVLPPLRDLLDFAQRARHGDLSMRIQHTGRDELGQLGNAFNGMADDLSRIYADLEQRVGEQTADLERSNQTLKMLYNTTSRLSDAKLSSTVYTELLTDIEQLVGFGPGVICLAQSTGDSVVTLASTRDDSDTTPIRCRPENCLSCMDQHETLVKRWREDGTPLEAITIPIQEQGVNYGILFISIPPGKKVEEWHLQLLEAIVGHMSLSIGRAYRASVGKRLALHEERGVIARELHDSLAQSLSYLKIQVVRLNKILMAADTHSPSALDITGDIRGGLNGAYQQLRELLTTFRLKPDEKGFDQTLSDTVREFKQRGELEINLDNKLYDLQLNENEEVHTLQVIREALSNVVRHANATRASVALKGLPNAAIEVSVEDNGCGLPKAPERRSHYGLAIMNERVSSLKGMLEIHAAPQGGTIVKFTFTPKQSKTSTTDQLSREL